MPMDRHIRPQGNHETINAGTTWFLLLTVLFLVGLSYGRIMTRGGYADDFAFLAYSTTNSYMDAALGWISTFNSRISQGIIMPLLLKGLSSNHPSGFHWGIYHAIGLAAFAITIVYIYRVLSLFNIPWHVSFVAISIFALNPVKNEALLWPATIVGYILPLCFFVVATWLYFDRAKRNTNTLLVRIIYSFLFVISILSIEQLLPLFVVVVAIRLVFLGFSQRQLVANLSAILLVASIFLLITISGRTTERIDRFTAIDIGSVPSHIVNVLAGSVIEILGHAPRILLDPYYHSELSSAALSAGYIFSAFVIISSAAWFSRRLVGMPGKTPGSTRILVLLVVTGIIIWFSSLSPFMVLSYYVPARSLYIPSLGAALIAGAVFGYICIILQQRWQRAVMVSAFSFLLAVYVLINRYSEQDFALQWENEKLIIDYIDANKDQIPEGTELAIFNVPRTHGPTPGFVNRYAFNGMVNWIAPGRNLEGHTLKDFSDIFQIPVDISQHNQYSVHPQENYWALLWTPDSVMRLGSIKLLRDQNALSTAASNVVTSSAESSGIQPVELSGIIRSVNRSAYYNGDISVHVTSMIIAPQIDSGLVQVSVKGPALMQNKYRLILHARHPDGSSIPYDVTLSPDRGFQEGNTGFSKYFFIENFSCVDTLQISLTSQGVQVLKVSSLDNANVSRESHESGITDSVRSPTVRFY